MPKRSLVPAAALIEAKRVMSERQIQDNVVREARGLGFLVYHTWISARSDPGFPDLVLARPEGHKPAWGLVVECKTENGVVSGAQREWLTALAAAFHCDALVVRPSTLEALYRVLLGSATEADMEALRP